MEEEEESHPSMPSSSSSLPNTTTTTTNSSTIRFLGFVTQPESDSTTFELVESDVIWSSSDFSIGSTPNIDPISPPLSIHSDSPTHHHFRQEKFGLSAALSDDHDHHSPLVQRKPISSLIPSSLSAARMIPPITFPRSVSSSDDSGKFHSAPVNVPNWGKTNSYKSPDLGFWEEEEVDGKVDEMLPPHEIVARSHVSTFSVFEGVGRTLKGRDLRRVRNAVWQKTGFKD